jgi:hypothetical protein
MEELGIESKVNPIIIGYQTDPDFTKGINLVFYAKIDKSSQEINEIHKKALAPYKAALDLGMTESEARKNIAKAGFPNIDAWEHRNLIFVDNSQEAIKKAVRSRSLQYDSKSVPMIDLGRGALMLYDACPKESLPK